MCNEGNEEATTTKKTSDICEISDILLWALFANRKEIAEICWIRGENNICKGFHVFVCFVFGDDCIGIYVKFNSLVHREKIIEMK